MKRFVLLWARGMSGAGSAGRRVSGEPESSTAGSPRYISYSVALGHVWRQL